MEMQDMRLAMFPNEGGSGKVSGALVQSNFHKPSAYGTVVYLNAIPDLSLMLEKIETAGGKVIMPRTQISPEIGYMAFFIDTEGNRVALHSQG